MPSGFKKYCKGLSIFVFLSAIAPAEFCFAQAQTSFLKPQDNSFSLKKVFQMPFLQSRPIENVWTSGFLTPEFIKEMNNVFAKEQPFEQETEADFWAQDARENLEEFKTERADVNQSIDQIADFSVEIFPETDALVRDFVKDIDQADLDINNLYLTYHSQKEATQDIDRWQDLEQSIEGLALIDIVFARLMSGAEKADKKVDSVLFEKEKDLTVFDRYSTDLDLYASETQATTALKDYELSLWDLWVSDLYDLSSTVETSAHDLAFWEREDLELDTPQISAKIRKVKPAEKDRLIKILKRALEQED